MGYSYSAKYIIRVAKIGISYKDFIGNRHNNNKLLTYAIT